MKRVSLQYFGLLREQRGLAAEEVATAAANCAELYRELAARHGFTLPAASCRAAVNHAFAAPDAALADGDVVAFLPPVAGG